MAICPLGLMHRETKIKSVESLALVSSIATLCLILSCSQNAFNGLREKFTRRFNVDSMLEIRDSRDVRYN